MSSLQEVLDHNRSVQQLAHTLNVRLGQQRFPAMMREELAEWIAERLGGAALCVSDVTDPEVLRLPALDPEAVAQVQSECPDTIEVCGYDVPVSYTESGPCVCVVSVNDHRPLKVLLEALPNDGVKLPDGRVVRVGLEVRECGWQTFKDRDIPSLKAAVCAKANERQWQTWMARPEILQPDFSTAVVEIPIVEAVYGTCVVRDVELKAYGTFTIRSGYWDSEIKIGPEWFQTYEQAEAARGKILERLSEVREKILASIRKEQLKAQVEDLRRQLSEIECGSTTNALPKDLLEDLDACTRAGSRIYTGTSECEGWILRAQRIIAEVEKVTRAQQAKEADERAANAAIIAVMGNEISAREARGVAETLVRVYENNRGGATTFLQELIASDKGARRKQDALREKLRNRLGTRDAGYRFFNLSKAEEINRWLHGMLAALTGKAPSDISAPSPAAAPGGLDLSGLRARFGKS